MKIAIHKIGAFTIVDYYDANNLRIDRDIEARPLRVKVQAAQSIRPYLQIGKTLEYPKVYPEMLKDVSITDVYTLSEYFANKGFFSGKETTMFVGGSASFTGTGDTVTVTDENIASNDTIKTSDSQNENETFSDPVVSAGSFTLTRSRNNPLIPFSNSPEFTWFVEN